MPHRDRERQREAERRWYRANRDRVIEKKNRKRERLRAHIRTLKEQPCTDCGVAYPYYVMDFDHVRGEKAALISELVLRSGTQKLLAELDKCDVVCANCHRIRTWTRMQLGAPSDRPRSPTVAAGLAQLSLFGDSAGVDDAPG